MRILTMPLSLAFAFLLYLPLPAADEKIQAALRTLFRHVTRLFTGKNGHADEPVALGFFLLILAGCASLLGAIHPLLAAAVCAPAFSALAVIPRSAAVKRELDAGTYARDIAAYELRVLESCGQLAPAFSRGACAPLLLMAAGMPFYLSSAFLVAYAGLCAVREPCALAQKICNRIAYGSDRVLAALMLLCCGVVGRNPLRTGGSGPQERLMSVLGIAGDEADTHAPVSGDIAQGVFLCCFCIVLLCALLTLLLLPLVS